MNSFSSSEISDLFGNGFRLEQKHPPLYLAECFQRLCPSLQRMNPSYLAEAIIRSNGRIFEGGGVLRGEILNLNFFFELWKQNFRFESGIYDKFTFGDELRLAYKINSRDFWDVLIRADRDLGTYLKDSMELFRHRELPQAISLNLRPNGSSVDDKTVRLLREKLPFNRDNFTTHEIAKTCLQLFEVSSPADYDVRRLAEELERENGIRRLNGEPFCVIPKKALDRLSTKCVLEFFKSKPLASNEASAMDRGVYAVTEADVILAQRQGSEAFWQSIIPDKTIRERTLNMWKLAGMDSDARRFTAGKQILIATDRALSDALYKHSAEMREVYGMCRQAGVSTQEADKFMAMLYLCHGFYKLPDINIDYTFIGKMKQSDARGLWETMQKEAFTSTGVARVNGAGKKLVEEEERQSKLAQQQLLVRGDYRGYGDPVEPAYSPLEHRQDGGTMKASTNAITEIKRSEFFVPYFYDDRDSSNPRKRVYKKDKHLVKGILTIGYGTTKITPEREKAFDQGITETQAEAWVIEDIENIFLADLQRYTKGLFLNQNQFDALMSVIYNMGATKFYKDSGIMEAIRTKDHKKIANAIENSYLAVPKHFQNGIKDRRLRERSLYERIP